MTWYRPAVHNCTTAANTPTLQLQELIAYFTVLNSDANFPWQVASSSNTGTLNYLVLKRKNGAPGRVMFFGGTVNPSTAGLASGVAQSTNFSYVGFALTSTVDTPNNYTTGTPYLLPDFSGGIIAFNNATMTNIQAYSKDDQLFVHYRNSSQSCVNLIGDSIVTDRSNTQFYSGVQSLGIIQNFAWALQGVSPTSTTTTNVSSSPDARIFVTNQWIRMARLSYNSDMVSSIALSALTDAANNVFFYPLFSFSCYDVSTPALRIYVKNKNVAMSPGKIFGYQWVDNNSDPRGYYIGSSLSLGADSIGTSLTNDDM